jgi:hypothetical protein
VLLSRSHGSAARATARRTYPTGCTANEEQSGIRLAVGRKPRPWRECRHSGQRRMEPLWSPVVASSGNQRQVGCRQQARDHAKTVAVGCVQVLRAAHGKEGVDGSSPSEGSARGPQSGAFCFPNTCTIQRAAGMEPSGSARALEVSEMDAFAGKIVGWRRADMTRTGSIRPSSWRSDGTATRVPTPARAAHRAAQVQVASTSAPGTSRSKRSTRS